MSNFFDELKDAIENCRMEEKLLHRWIDNHEWVSSTIDLIDSLGENARRMLEIGVVQDELIKLGFEHHGEYLSCLFLQGKKIMIDFRVTDVVLIWQNLSFSYSSPTWQQDLLQRVKELINDI